ncbi:glutamine synthetase family protein [Mesorhizobium sp. UC74_2]|uniref:glutamine synthetase family protein n=1 Tax=Mesorhizobium sp. UC74_2 TaxID=3350171 RepID=UPI00366E1187
MTDTAKWLEQQAISEVECLVPDMNGVLRGKIVPAPKLLAAPDDAAIMLPNSAFMVAVTGHYSGAIDDESAYQDADMRLQPDLTSLCLAAATRPGPAPKRAYVFCDAFAQDGTPWPSAPRQVLKSVIALYAARGWRPVMAPELEFYLTAPNPDPNVPPGAPVGVSGRAETSPAPYDMEALGEFQPVIDEIYRQAEMMALPLDTMIHETGAGQLEINFKHGDPLRLADQVLLFKRLVRQAAREHGLAATFMAKPIAEQASSSMHLHMSVVDAASGLNLFADEDDGDSALFSQFIGGLQAYVPQAMPLFAPNVNSFRRLKPGFSAPNNVEWARDNRTCGLRVPGSKRIGRRVENRLPGADANPYLAMAGSLLCGYLGIEEGLERRAEAPANAYRIKPDLPRTLEDALARLDACEPVRRLLGQSFTNAFLRLKQVELDNFQGVITAWERDHLFARA